MRSGVPVAWVVKALTLVGMLERTEFANGVVGYQSPLLQEIGVPHAFSTRIGGVSASPFASLNLGNPNGCPAQDDPANIVRNYRLLQEAIGCGSRRRVFTHQVHGACIADVPGTNVTDSIHGRDELGKADAIASRDPAALASIRVADCVPILIASTDGATVAAVHAGWRGVVAEILKAVMLRFNGSECRIAIGPHISANHFEVGEEVAAQFPPDAVVRAPGRKPHVDLQRAIVLQLKGIGVPEAHIDITDRCTVTHADEFFSHRRDDGVTGRMAALIGVAT